MLRIDKDVCVKRTFNKVTRIQENVDAIKCVFISLQSPEYPMTPIGAGLSLIYPLHDTLFIRSDSSYFKGLNVRVQVFQ